ncbi:glycosyltransferase family 2 protein [Patescibacteria group bacterium]|nr:glycosyltransferase family 2 protein [Patescibacteria group bacterium]
MTTVITTSWVLRTKNEEKHIGEVLEMLKNQTRKDFEIIVIDSGSTDGTLEIVRKYPIRLISIKPEEFNYSYALNRAIKFARGQYIGILSGHSIPITASFYEDGLKLFSDSKVAAISGHYVDENFKIGKKLVLRRKEQHFIADMTNTNSMIRKKLWKSYHFDEKLMFGCEDYDWALEMLARGYDVVKVPAFSTIYYRVNGKPSYWKMKPIWNQVCKELRQKRRPSKSFSILN